MESGCTPSHFLSVEGERAERGLGLRTHGVLSRVFCVCRSPFPFGVV